MRNRLVIDLRVERVAGMRLARLRLELGHETDDGTREATERRTLNADAERFKGPKRCCNSGTCRPWSQMGQIPPPPSRCPQQQHKLHTRTHSSLAFGQKLKASHFLNCCLG